jgi:hypothetical protein
MPFQHPETETSDLRSPQVARLSKLA